MAKRSKRGQKPKITPADRLEEIQGNLNAVLREVRTLRETMTDLTARSRYPHPFEPAIAHDRRRRSSDDDPTVN